MSEFFSPDSTDSCPICGELLRGQQAVCPNCDDPPSSSPTQPDPTRKDVLVSESKRGTRRVTVDHDSETVTFEKCHVSRKFFAVRQQTFSCSFSEILDVYDFRSIPGAMPELRIVTSTGRATVAGNASNYEELRDVLSPIAAATPVGPALDNPNMVLVLLLGGGIGGLGFFGYLQTLEITTTSMMAVFLVGLAFFGITPALFVLLVYVGDRAWNINLVPPLAAAGGVIVGGLPLFDSLIHRALGNTVFLVSWGLCVVLAGGLGLCFVKRRRKPKCEDTSP